MPHSLYPLVAERAGHRCEFCLAPEAVFNQEFEVEHLIPASRGGTTVLDNLALACRSCNGRKWNATEAHDPETGELAPLFNPRTDEWDEHFRLNVMSAEIEGGTAMGRATVKRLGMNRPIALRGRGRWLAKGFW